VPAVIKVSLDEFRAMLTDPDPDVRWQARMLFLLPIYGHELYEVDRTRREFRAMLTDPDPVVRQRAEHLDRSRLWGAPRDNVQVVLEVLADDTAVEAWPGCVELVSAIAPDELKFDWLVTVMARTSSDGLGNRLATALGLPGGRDLPRFTTEQAGEDAHVTCCFCTPDAIEAKGCDDTTHAVPATQCKRVPALVALLGSRHERVQQRAVRRLAELGPGVAGVLRTVCRSRTPSRRGAVAALAEIGWHELDPADRDLLTQQPAHHLLPAAMRELSWPWNDLHDTLRSRKLKKLPHTRANERAALDALTTALSDLPSALQDIRHDESWEELFDRFADKAWYDLRVAGRRPHLLTREAVTEVLRKWAEWADPPVPDWWLKGQSDQIARKWADIVFSDWAGDLLWWLQEEPRNAERLTEVAERCIKNNLAVTSALILLLSVGAPHGEQALLRVVRDDGMSEDHRTRARELLIVLRGRATGAR
jgi:hypothetical protein